MTKLTDEDAELVFQLLEYADDLRMRLENLSCRAVGSLFGVSGNAIWHLWNGSTHGWLAQRRALARAKKP